MAKYYTVLFMDEDVVNVERNNSFVVKFEMRELVRFLQFTLIKRCATWWTKESLMDNDYNYIHNFVFQSWGI
jgi:hypothetical protein